MNVHPLVDGDAEDVREVHLKAVAGCEDEARLVEALDGAVVTPSHW